MEPSARQQKAKEKSEVWGEFERAEKTVRLRQIFPFAGPMVFKSDDMSDIWCIAIGRGDKYFEFDEAIDFARSLSNANFRDGRTYLPSLFVFANLKQLSSAQQRRMADVVRATGLNLVNWPKGSSSQKDAIKRLVEELKPQFESRTAPANFAELSNVDAVTSFRVRPQASRRPSSKRKRTRQAPARV